MSNDKSVAGLHRHAEERSRRKSMDVLRAIEDCTEVGTDISIAAICRQAGVSREFIHSHAALHSAVIRAREAQMQTRTAIEGTGTKRDAMRADRITLFAKIQRQRDQIAELKAQAVEHEKLRQKWLGWQLDSYRNIDPEIHLELRITSERLTAESITLRRQVSELNRLVDTLKRDLTASREAHAEDLARLDQRDNVHQMTLPTRPPSTLSNSEQSIGD